MISAAYNITNQRDAVNALNVFPVPDGDTARCRTAIRGPICR